MQMLPDSQWFTIVKTFKKHRIYKKNVKPAQEKGTKIAKKIKPIRTGSKKEASILLSKDYRQTARLLSSFKILAEWKSFKFYSRE